MPLLHAFGWLGEQRCQKAPAEEPVSACEHLCYCLARAVRQTRQTVLSCLGSSLLVSA